MVRTIMIGALAAGALAMAGTAAAKPGGAKSGKPAAAAKAQAKAQAKVHKKARAMARGAGIGEQGAAMRAKGRANSQGPANASARGIERSSANSVLKGSTVVAGPLTSLDPGETVYSSVDGSLQPVGTVERIVPMKDGRVSNVLVRLTDGRVVPLAPGSLTLDTTSQQWTAATLRPNANRN